MRPELIGLNQELWRGHLKKFFEENDKMKKWLALAKVLGPIILTTVKPELAPITGTITDAITEAEQIPGAKGADKLQHVKNIAIGAAGAVNTARGKEVIDVKTLNTAVESATNTVVEVVNLLHKKAG